MLGSALWSRQAVPLEVPVKVEQLHSQLQTLRSEEKKLALLSGALSALSSESPGECIVLADEALRISTHLHDAASIPPILYHRGLARRQVGDYSGSAADLGEAYDHLMTLGRTVEAAEVALDAGHTVARFGELATAHEWFNRALEGSSGSVRARTLSSLASLYMDAGDLVSALSAAEQALEIVESLGSDEPVGVVHSSLGVIHGLLEDYDRAYHHFTIALEAFQRSGNRYLEIRTLSNLGQIHVWRGELDDALDYATTSLLAYEELSDADGAAHSLAAIASIHERRGDISTALSYNERALSMLDSQATSPFHVDCLLGVGRLSLAVGDADQAKAALEEALELANELENLALRAAAHDELAHFYEWSGDLRIALEHHRAGRDLHDQLSGPERQRGATLVQVRLAERRSEQRIAELETRIASLGEQIAAKQYDVSRLALQLMEKTELLDSLRRGIADLVKGGNVSVTARKQLSSLLDALRPVPGSQDSWNSFEAQFEQVHGVFLQTLATRFPELTATETKVCALLRLGMPSKEIATLLHMSPRTVESHRYAVRKKLGLSTSRNLKTFLGEMDMVG